MLQKIYLNGLLLFKSKFFFVLGAIIIFPVLVLFQNCSGGMQSNMGAVQIGAENTQGVISAPSITFETSFSGVVQVSEPTIVFVGENLIEKKATYECRVDEGLWLSCISPYKTPKLSDGSHKVIVRAKDSQQNILVTTEPLVFSVDATKPVVTLQNPPSALSSLVDVVLMFQATDQSSGVKHTECSLDGAAYAVCSSPLSLSKLIDGDHNFKIRTVDNAGNISDVVSAVWKIDLSVPSVAFSSSNVAASKDDIQNIAFTAANKSGGSLKIECSLDGAVFTACISPYQAKSLNEGTHRLKVKVTNSVLQATESQYAWVIDRTPPIVKIGIPPAALSQQKRPPIGYSVEDSLTAVTKVECKIDAEAYKVCTAPVIQSDLADGNHTVTFKATNAVGLVSAEVSTSFAVDLTPPVLNITNAPATNATNITMSVLEVKDNFTVAPVVTYVLNGGSEQIYSSSVKYSDLPDGNYNLTFKAVDEVGLMTRKSVSWLIDRTPPTQPGTISYVAVPAPMVSWVASTDALSSVSYYEVSFGKTPGAVDLINWVKSSSNAAYQINTSSFASVPTDYYFNVRAVDTLGYKSVVSTGGPYKMPPSLQNFQELFLGGSNACALVESGVLKCWGDLNNQGWLSTNSKLYFGNEHTSPVTIDLPNILKVSSSGTFACGLFSNKAIKCWGINRSGQLGDGTFNTGNLPRADLLSAVNDIQVAGSHACALMADSTVKCWGYNGVGDARDFNNGSYQLVNVTPRDLGLTNVQSISVAAGTSCALMKDTTVRCWRFNGTGQVDSPHESVAPYAVNLSGVKKVVTTTMFGCALLQDGDVKCWNHLNGLNKMFGVLGDGTENESLSPVNVVNINKGAVDISTGPNSTHTCVLMNDSTVRCWGRGYGAMGNNTNNQRNPAAVTASLTNVSKVYVGGERTCALKEGSLYCWGSNASGLMGKTYTQMPSSLVPYDLGFTK